jgi:hypothetical protein
MILGPVDLGEDRLTVTRSSSSADISGNSRDPRPSNTRICSYHLGELMAQGSLPPSGRYATGSLWLQARLPADRGGTPVASVATRAVGQASRPLAPASAAPAP